MHTHRHVAFGLVLAVGMAACGSSDADPGGSTGPGPTGGERDEQRLREQELASRTDEERVTDRFIEALREVDTASHAGTVQQPFLSVPGTVLQTRGGMVQHYSYSTEQAAEAERTRLVSETATVDWLAPPAFFHRGTEIVIQLGDDETLRRFLTARYGEPFHRAEGSGPDDRLRMTDIPCERDADCVPASCCHPDSCVAAADAPDCSEVACTENCEPDTLDCGGACACVEGRCAARLALPSPGGG